MLEKKQLLRISKCLVYCKTKLNIAEYLWLGLINWAQQKDYTGNASKDWDYLTKASTFSFLYILAISFYLQFAAVYSSIILLRSYKYLALSELSAKSRSNERKRRNKCFTLHLTCFPRIDERKAALPLFTQHPHPSLYPIFNLHHWYNSGSLSRNAPSSFIEVNSLTLPGPTSSLRSSASSFPSKTKSLYRSFYDLR